MRIRLRSIVRDQAGGLTESTGVAAQRRPPGNSEKRDAPPEGCQPARVRQTELARVVWHPSRMRTISFLNRRSPLRCDRRLLSGSPPGCTALRTADRTPCEKATDVHGKRTPPNLDVSWDHEPEMHKSFKIKRPILRFMESFVFRSDLLTGHEPSSRWDRRHPCRRVARGLPRRQGCRRSQVHGKRPGSGCPNGNA